MTLESIEFEFKILIDQQDRDLEIAVQSSDLLKAQAALASKSALVNMRRRLRYIAEAEKKREQQKMVNIDRRKEKGLKRTSA